MERLIDVIRNIKLYHLCYHCDNYDEDSSIDTCKSEGCNCVEEIAQQIRNELIDEVIEKITTGLDEGIHCAMCTNTMANDRGCDGGCVVNQGMYERVMKVIDKNINRAKKVRTWE